MTKVTIARNGAVIVDGRLTDMLLQKYDNGNRNRGWWLGGPRYNTAVNDNDRPFIAQWRTKKDAIAALTYLANNLVS